MKILRINDASDPHFKTIHYIDMSYFQCFRTSNMDEIIDMKKSLNFLDHKLESYKYNSVQIYFNVNGNLSFYEGICPELDIPLFEKFLLDPTVLFHTLNLIWHNSEEYEKFLKESLDK